jgi:hypothetical protein
MAVLLGLVSTTVLAAPLGTAFTYQGRLAEAGAPVNGFYDFRLGVFDDEALGNLVGLRVDLTAVPVSNGLFTVQCDPGEGVFDGSPRWLQISVRTNAGGSLRTLSPRQPIATAPYALYAPNAGQATGANVANSVIAGGVNGTALAANSVDGGKILDSSVTEADLSGAVRSNTFWRLGGNSGTFPGPSFLGTGDNQPLELKVNGQRALRLEPNATSPNTVAGHSANAVSNSVYGATIGGGGSAIQPNQVGHLFGTVGGGAGNTNSAFSGVIAGGSANTIGFFSSRSVIGGGEGNTIGREAVQATIGGGFGNTIQTNASSATIAGGTNNAIETSARAATIAGGQNNRILSSGPGYGAQHAFIGGGADNAIDFSALAAGILGGYGNLIGYQSDQASIGGGAYNQIEPNAAWSVIGGGQQNFVSLYSYHATIPGGFSNRVVNGSYSLAAGRRASALNQGTFVWADSRDAEFPSTGNNQFLIRANGGVGINTNNPQAALHVAGMVKADGFNGSGAALTSLNGASLADSSITAAKFAPGAVNHLDAPDGSPTNAVQVSTNGLVGLGTATPAAALHLAGGPAIYRPLVRYQVEQYMDNFTNVSGLNNVAASGDVLALTAQSDKSVTIYTNLLNNPWNPKVSAHLHDGDGIYTNLAGVRGLALNGGLMAVAAASDNAVTLISVTNPAQPVRLAELRQGVGAFNYLTGAGTVVLSGNLLAVSASTDNAVTLVDVSVPTNPQFRAVLRQGQNGFNQISQPGALALSGNLLAISSSTLNAVTLVDVSNPASPQLRAVMKDYVGSASLRYPGAVEFSGSLLAIASELYDGVLLVDVSNPANPQWRSTIQPPNLIWANDLAFRGNLLTIAGTREVFVADVSNPSAPVMKGILLTGQAGWSYPIFPSALAFSGTNLAVLGSAYPYGWSLVALVEAQVNLAANQFVGIGTTMPQAPLHVVGNVVVQDAEHITLRSESIALGDDTVASGYYSLAAGTSSTASGDYATALGFNTDASEMGSTALGIATTASGKASTALGWSTRAEGESSTALGYGTEATGKNSMAAGYATHAQHNGTFVWADMSSGYVFGSTSSNQFLIRATNGVGIGLNNPQAALHVAGTVKADAFVGTGPTPASFPRLGVGTSSPEDAVLDVEGDMHLNDFDLFLRGGTDRNHGLGWYGLTKPFAGGNVDGPVLYGWTGGGLGSMTGGPRLALQWDATGSVAVDAGTLNAGGLAPGLVFGGLGSGEGIASKRTAGANQFALNFHTSFSNRMTILSTGDIGIGTLSPVRRLHVMDGSGPTRAGGSIQVGMTTTGGDPKLVYFGDGDYVHIGENGSDDTLELKATRFFFTGGNLGIGINDPTNKIAVAGGAYCTGTQWVNASDRERKEGFQAVDSEAVLQRVAALPLSTWNYKEDPSSRHVGPTAQDFHAAFGFGNDAKAIGTVDADGVALAAIQGLNRKLAQQTAALKARDAELQALTTTVAELQQAVRRLTQTSLREERP